MRFQWTAAAAILLLATHASAQSAATLSCSATHVVSCDGADCRSEWPEEGDTIYVGFELSTLSGRGNLCTYTYCRDFMLAPLPGDSLDDALKKLSGLTLSEKRGSTGEDLERPAFDYQLSISEDRGRFVLGTLFDGGFSGWAGKCTTAR
jgi:hypothetical protein